MGPIHPRHSDRRLPRRALLGTALAAALPLRVRSQPLDRTARMLVGFPPGGGR